MENHNTLSTWASWIDFNHIFTYPTAMNLSVPWIDMKKALYTWPYTEFYLCTAFRKEPRQLHPNGLFYIGIPLKIIDFQQRAEYGFILTAVDRRYLRSHDTRNTYSINIFISTVCCENSWLHCFCVSTARLWICAWIPLMTILYETSSTGSCFLYIPYNLL